MPGEKKMKVKQVRYQLWGTGSRQYWHDIGAIAEYIAAAMNYPVPRCNGFGLPGSGMVSTIRVDQFKEKFGDVRIYCRIAAPELVDEAYEHLRKRVDERKLDAATAFQLTKERYARQRYVDDARTYRNAYLSMVKLVPKYRDAILVAADYRELLCEDEDELERFIDKNLEGLEQKLGLKGRDAVQAELYELCEFKLKTE
jgi:hypothetical protein